MKIRIQRRKWMAAALLATVLTACGGGGGSSNSGIGLAPGFGAAPPPAQKIIIDSDYNTMSDDGQLGVMAAQLRELRGELFDASIADAHWGEEDSEEAPRAT